MYTSTGVLCTGHRFKILVLLGIIVIGSGSLMVIVFYGDSLPYIKHYAEYYSLSHYLQSSIGHHSTFYTDGEIRQMASQIKDMKKCDPHALLGSNKTHIWVRKENLPYYNLSSYTSIVCCYKSFYRPKSIKDIMSRKIDDRVKYNKCRFFSDSIAVEDEFVRVNCSHGKDLFQSFFVYARKKKMSIQPKNRYNILILGIDGVSRLNLHRTMPKTVSFLNDLGAVELLRYNKVGDNTFPNLVPLLLGKHESEMQETCWPNKNLTFDNCPFIWERFQRAGFSTAYVEDYAKIATFNYLKRGFAGYPTDYYLRTFIHEAEAYTRTKNKGKFSICLNEKYMFKIILDYVEDLTALSTIRLFGFFWENSITHDNLNYASAMDEDYSAMFMRMQSSGYLNKSIIFVLSDHGFRWGKFRKTRQGFLEDRLPFILVVTPPSFRTNFNEAYKNLVQNVHRLTTPFDVHETLIDLVNLYNIENSKILSRTYDFYSNQRNISLFLPIPENRTCESAAIDAHWCVDNGNTKEDLNSTLAREAVKYAMSHLNGLLKKNPECAELTLDKVLLATRLIYDSSKEKIKKSVELTVAFRTNPGGGEFEATLGRQGGPGSPWLLLGSASRVNAYGNQSHCIQDQQHDAQLKLYCYCIHV
ncbi:uncharacterized protein LOC125231994 [Leguminivora glycinivorella]|uniref:uncharacterized protein LOC125231994 n=1 Tax=Leguminivora glycinivorella TaxID=1035111 RepID=UPI00201026B2|nr:uncharacterized protein LOC125231994 [Leguminivora glycinivorella]